MSMRALTCLFGSATVLSLHSIQEQFLTASGFFHFLVYYSRKQL